MIWKSMRNVTREHKRRQTFVFLTEVWRWAIASYVQLISVMCMGSQHSMPAACEPFISLTPCVASLLGKKWFIPHAMTGRKIPHMFSKAIREGLVSTSPSSIRLHWPFDMHTWISSAEALWHRQPVEGPIGRQGESTSLPPTLICSFEWWDVARGTHSGTDHLEVMYHWDIISQTTGKHFRTTKVTPSLWNYNAGTGWFDVNDREISNRWIMLDKSGSTYSNSKKNLNKWANDKSRISP